jgi:DNA polymerase III subunit delta
VPAPRDGGVLPSAAFLTAIRKGKRYPVLLLHGSEEYLLRQAVREYTALALDPAAADFDFSEFRSQEVSGETLFNALTTLPFMASHRLVVLELSGEPNKEIAEVLKRYSALPAPTTLLLLVSSESGRAARGGELPSSVVEVEFRELKESERARWAADYVKRENVELKPDALRYLIESSSSSLSDIAAKLDHALLYLGEEKELTAQVLMKVSGVSSEYTVFNLEDAILSGQTVLAHQIARSLLDGGEVLLRLLAFQRGIILKLWQVSAVIQKPGSWFKSQEATDFWEKVLKRQNFKKDIYLNAAKRIGAERLREAVTGILDVEVALKSRSDDPFPYYEWIWKITSDGRNSLEPVFPAKS